MKVRKFVREPFETRPWIHHKPRSTTLTFSSSTPWNATGYYYYPRYPESYRGDKQPWTCNKRLHIQDAIDLNLNIFFRYSLNLFSNWSKVRWRLLLRLLLPSLSLPILPVNHESKGPAWFGRLFWIKPRRLDWLQTNK